MKRKTLNCFEIGDRFRFHSNSELCEVRGFCYENGVRVCLYVYVKEHVFIEDSSTYVFPDKK